MATLAGAIGGRGREATKEDEIRIRDYVQKKKKKKMSSRERERDRDLELLIPVAGTSENGGSKSSSPSDSPLLATPHHSSREVCVSLFLFKSCLSPQFRIPAKFQLYSFFYGMINCSRYVEE